jgi:hypothetical protein
MNRAGLNIVVIAVLICSCRMYRASPDTLIKHEVKFFDSDKDDTLLDFSIDQAFRAAVTATHKNSSCIYLGKASRIKRRKVNVAATKRLFEAYNQQSKNPKSTTFEALIQSGDTLLLDDQSVSHVLLDDNIYWFNDFSFAVSEFRRILKNDGTLVLRIMEFRKALLLPKKQKAFASKPEGTTEAIKEYFEQRGFKLKETHKIVLDKPSARASKEKELVFLFAKV